jgi:hypothetical protein
MVGYRLTLNDFEGFVVFECQRVLGGGAFVWDFGDFRKCGLQLHSDGIILSRRPFVAHSSYPGDRD